MFLTTIFYQVPCIKDIRTHKRPGSMPTRIHDAAVSSSGAGGGDLVQKLSLKSEEHQE